ncbi:SGNH/GDSL hydrolase family protein [Actinoplanes sp. NPDC049596]|uniref:SGNH/GDSL hydrolase family protein n=1 Tax=unclassified Actinoplanes TaxID=2626549 RepID=UPI00342E75B7
MLSRRLLAGAAATAAALVALAPGAAQAACRTDSYVALGDSYAAGTGSPPYTDAQCRRSDAGYPVLLAAKLHEKSFEFEACAGATVQDVLDKQIDDLGRRTRLVTLTIGGNDLGFGTGINTCLTGTDADCEKVVDDAVTFSRDTLPGRLDRVYRAVHERAPHAKLVVADYAHFFETTPDCGSLPVSLVKRVALNRAVDVLDQSIAQAAHRAGAGFADVRTAFAGHGLCGADPWITNPAQTDPFHPTATGHLDGYLPAVSRAVAHHA